MDFSFDICLIYRQYCDLVSELYVNEREGFRGEDHNGKMLRNALAQLLNVVETKISTRISILEEIYKLMLTLDLRTDSLEFKRFYNFVFFICRENGQKNITVSRAVMAWRLVLLGRFRLLNDWCSFIEKNQRYNISEDTWCQVLAFSRCVHENLEGYDPNGAWPILIDDFVEHMYRTRESQAKPNLCCSCGASEPSQLNDLLPVLRSYPGSKRKFTGMDVEMEDESLEVRESCRIASYVKRQHSDKHWMNDCPEMAKTKSSHCNKSHCAVEGLAGLSVSSGPQFRQGRRVFYRAAHS